MAPAGVPFEQPIRRGGSGRPKGSKDKGIRKAGSGRPKGSKDKKPRKPGSGRPKSETTLMGEAAPAIMQQLQQSPYMPPAPQALSVPMQQPLPPMGGVTVDAASQSAASPGTVQGLVDWSQGSLHEGAARLGL